MNNSIRIILVKTIIIKVNAIKNYIKYTHFITIKYYISRILLPESYYPTRIKRVYIFICKQSSKMLFNHFTCNKPIRSKI